MEDYTDEERFNKYVKTGFNISKWVATGIFGLTALLTSIYAVGPDSNAVVRRFGKYNRTASPGLHLKLPFAFERVNIVPVKNIQKEEFGFRTEKAGVRTEYVDANTRADTLERILRAEKEDSSNPSWQSVKDLFQKEYLMLTGDLNMADVQWIVQYQIKDPVKYLFNLRDKRKTIRDMSEAVTRQIVGDRSVDEVITVGRTEIQLESEKKLQEVLDLYDAGVHIVTVKLQSVDPPEKVRDSFNEVNQAKQEKETMINNAWKDYNQVIPKAHGDAEKMIKDAEAYAIDRINTALGDAARFSRIYNEYKNAKDVTRTRLYLETLGEALQKIDEKWVIEQKGAEGGLLQRLDLGGKNGKE